MNMNEDLQIVSSLERQLELKEEFEGPPQIEICDGNSPPVIASGPQSNTNLALPEAGPGSRNPGALGEAAGANRADTMQQILSDLNRDTNNVSPNQQYFQRDIGSIEAYDDSIADMDVFKQKGQIKSGDEPSAAGTADNIMINFSLLTEEEQRLQKMGGASAKEPSEPIAQMSNYLEKKSYKFFMTDEHGQPLQKPEPEPVSTQEPPVEAFFKKKRISTVSSQRAALDISIADVQQNFHNVMMMDTISYGKQSRKSAKGRKPLSNQSPFFTTAGATCGGQGAQGSQGGHEAEMATDGHGQIIRNSRNMQNIKQYFQILEQIGKNEKEEGPEAQEQNTQYAVSNRPSNFGGTLSMSTSKERAVQSGQRGPTGGGATGSSNNNFNDTHGTNGTLGLTHGTNALPGHLGGEGAILGAPAPVGQSLRSSQRPESVGQIQGQKLPGQMGKDQIIKEGKIETTSSKGRVKNSEADTNAIQFGPNECGGFNDVTKLMKLDNNLSSSQNEKSLNALLAQNSRENIQIQKLVRGNTQSINSKEMSQGHPPQVHVGSLATNKDLSDLSIDEGTDFNDSIKKEQATAEEGPQARNSQHQTNAAGIAGSSSIRMIVNQQRKRRSSNLVSQVVKSKQNIGNGQVAYARGSTNQARSDKLAMLQPEQQKTQSVANNSNANVQEGEGVLNFSNVASRPSMTQQGSSWTRSNRRVMSSKNNAINRNVILVKSYQQQDTQAQKQSQSSKRGSLERVTISPQPTQLINENGLTDTHDLDREGLYLNQQSQDAGSSSKDHTNLNPPYKQMLPVSRVNTLLLQQPSDVNLGGGQSPMANPYRQNQELSTKGSQKQLAPNYSQLSLGKLKNRQESGNLYLQEDNNTLSSYQNRITEMYQKTGRVPEPLIVQTNVPDRKEKTTKFKQLLDQFVLDPPVESSQAHRRKKHGKNDKAAEGKKHTGNNAHAQPDKSSAQKADGKKKEAKVEEAAEATKQEIVSLSMAIANKSLSSDTKSATQSGKYGYYRAPRPNYNSQLSQYQVERVIRNSYEPLGKDSALRVKVEKSKDRQKSYFQLLQDKKEQEQGKRTNMSMQNKKEASNQSRLKKNQLSTPEGQREKEGRGKKKQREEGQGLSVSQTGRTGHLEKSQYQQFSGTGSTQRMQALQKGHQRARKGLLSQEMNQRNSHNLARTHEGGLAGAAGSRGFASKQHFRNSGAVQEVASSQHTTFLNVKSGKNARSSNNTQFRTTVYNDTQGSSTRNIPIMSWNNVQSSNTEEITTQKSRIFSHNTMATNEERRGPTNQPNLDLLQRQVDLQKHRKLDLLGPKSSMSVKSPGSPNSTQMPIVDQQITLKSPKSIASGRPGESPVFSQKLIGLQMNPGSPQSNLQSFKSVFGPVNTVNNQRKGLGVLYQNRNKVMSIGDINGVKGDPAENISSKGIFEKSSEVVFDFGKTQVADLDFKSQQLLRSNVVRGERSYAQGAIQYQGKSQANLPYSENTQQSDPNMLKDRGYFKNLNSARDTNEGEGIDTNIKKMKELQKLKNRRIQTKESQNRCQNQLRNMKRVNAAKAILQEQSRTYGSDQVNLRFDQDFNKFYYTKQELTRGFGCKSGQGRPAGTNNTYSGEEEGADGKGNPGNVQHSLKHIQKLLSKDATSNDRVSNLRDAVSAIGDKPGKHKSNLHLNTRHLDENSSQPDRGSPDAGPVVVKLPAKPSVNTLNSDIINQDNTTQLSYPLQFHIIDTERILGQGGSSYDSKNRQEHSSRASQDITKKERYRSSNTDLEKRRLNEAAKLHHGLLQMPRVENQVDYWAQQERIYLEQQAQERSSIFQQIKELQGLQSSMPANIGGQNTAVNDPEQARMAQPLQSDKQLKPRNSYMGFKVPDMDPMHGVKVIPKRFRSMAHNQVRTHVKKGDEFRDEAQQSMMQSVKSLRSKATISRNLEDQMRQVQRNANMYCRRQQKLSDQVLSEAEQDHQIYVNQIVKEMTHMKASYNDDDEDLFEKLCTNPRGGLPAALRTKDTGAQVQELSLDALAGEESAQPAKQVSGDETQQAQATSGDPDDAAIRAQDGANGKQNGKQDRPNPMLIKDFLGDTKPQGKNVAAGHVGDHRLMTDAERDASDDASAYSERKGGLYGHPSPTRSNITDQSPTDNLKLGEYLDAKDQSHYKFDRETGPPQTLSHSLARDSQNLDQDKAPQNQASENHRSLPSNVSRPNSQQVARYQQQKDNGARQDSQKHTNLLEDEAKSDQSSREMELEAHKIAGVIEAASADIEANDEMKVSATPAGSQNEQ